MSKGSRRIADIRDRQAIGWPVTGYFVRAIAVRSQLSPEDRMFSGSPSMTDIPGRRCWSGGGQIRKRRRQAGKDDGLFAAINTAGNVEVGFIIHVEAASLTVDCFFDFTKQVFARRWREHPKIRPRA